MGAFQEKLLLENILVCNSIGDCWMMALVSWKLAVTIQKTIAYA